MSLTDNGGLSAADVAAVMGANNGGCGFGNGWGGDGAWWLLVLFLFAMNGNAWGNGFGGGNAGMMYPFMNANNDVQRGFDHSAVMGGLNGITAAISNGFANAEVSRCNANTNILQSMNGLAMALQNCCCENRAGLADLKYTVATEGCADRAASDRNTQQILTAMNAGFQGVHNKLCQQELDALKAENARLQTQINLANLQQSQTAQTARILQDNAAQTVALEQYLNPVPVPAYVVQNPNCCAPNYCNTGCGCAA